MGWLRADCVPVVAAAVAVVAVVVIGGNSECWLRETHTAHIASRRSNLTVTFRWLRCLIMTHAQQRWALISVSFSNVYTEKVSSEALRSAMYLLLSPCSSSSLNKCSVHGVSSHQSSPEIFFFQHKGKLGIISIANEVIIVVHYLLSKHFFAEIQMSFINVFCKDLGGW